MNESPKRRVTLVDIAADAGVSRATASLVIRNVSTVAEGTRKRVLKSIKRLGYVYHSGAANLRTQRSNAVGLIVSDITNPFFAEVSVAIEERLSASHCSFYSPSSRIRLRRGGQRARCTARSGASL